MKESALLWLLAPALAAQDPVLADESVRSVRIAWVSGVVKPVELRIDYGPADWRPSYEAEVAKKAARAFRLGRGGWPTMHVGAPMQLDKRALPPGIYYLALERSQQAAWSLSVFESAKILRAGALPGEAHGIKPAARFALQHAATSDPCDRLQVSFEKGGKPGVAKLALSWGKHRMTTELEIEVEPVAVPKPPAFRRLDPERAIATASGLRYEIVRDGVGRAPGPKSKVTVHYVGWLTDGTKFDASLDRGKPMTFGVHQVIRGWTEGLQRMNPGAVLLLEIPPELGYGARGAGPIPADATLLFWVELLAVQ